MMRAEGAPAAASGRYIGKMPAKLGGRYICVYSRSCMFLVASHQSLGPGGGGGGLAADLVPNFVTVRLL
jgi:hypothetical protein